MAQSAHTVPLMTVDEYLVYPIDDERAELVRGELRVTPAPDLTHGLVVSNVLRLLVPYVSERGLGRVFGDAVGYELVELPHTVRIPVVSFMSAARMPKDLAGRRLFSGAPDLAVEVLSPSETTSSLEEKLADYRMAKAALVWVIDPERRTVTIVAANEPVQWLRDGDTLTGGAVLAGFSAPVAELFDGLAG
jgi:Uma2 family endonuclease